MQSIILAMLRHTARNASLGKNFFGLLLVTLSPLFIFVFMLQVILERLAELDKIET